MKADIIVFTYNNETVISRCLDSVRKQSVRNFVCTVVDDCSTDNTVGLIRKKYPWVKLITKKKNTGPSESRNIGICHTKNEYIAMLDSDVGLKEDWLEQQLELMKDGSVAVAGSKLIFAKNRGKINSAGGCITRLGFGFDRGCGSDIGKYNMPEPVAFVCSAACMFRRDIVKKIGSFDETYFYPHEDTDFCWRAALAGYKIIYNPAAIAWHGVGETTRKMSSRVAFHATKNRIRSIIKNYSPMNVVKYLPLHLILLLGDIIFRGNRTAKARAIWWNIANIKGTLKARKAVQKTRQVADSGLVFNKWINEMV